MHTRTSPTSLTTFISATTFKHKFWASVEKCLASVHRILFVFQLNSTSFYSCDNLKCPYVSHIDIRRPRTNQLSAILYSIQGCPVSLVISQTFVTPNKGPPLNKNKGNRSKTHNPVSTIITHYTLYSLRYFCSFILSHYNTRRYTLRVIILSINGFSKKRILTRGKNPKHLIFDSLGCVASVYYLGVCFPSDFRP